MVSLIHSLLLLAVLPSIQPLGALSASATFEAFQASAELTNPLQGRGHPPPDAVFKMPQTKVPSIEVEANVYLERPFMQDGKDTYTVRLWWHLCWNDSRAYHLIKNASAEGCHFFCSSLANTIFASKNRTRDACCDNVYVPNARWRSFLGLEY